MLLALNSLCHFLVDALCVATLFGPAVATGDMALPVVMYNTMAFSTQCLVGLLADEFRRHSWSAAASILVVILGWLLPVGPVLKMAIVGLGNSIFHVAGGAMTLDGCGGKAGPLGVFVAPGAFGVTLGMLFSELAWIYALAMLLCIGIYIFISARCPYLVPQKPVIGERGRFPLAVVTLLTMAVAVRAVGGSAVSFLWKSGAALSIILTAFVFAGKTAGGFVLDMFGAKKAAWISIPLSALLIAFCSSWALPSMLGQFLLNLTMPVTLYLMYKAMPDSPGFAFGLAASALWPGTIAGQLLSLTGPALWICVIACFGFGLAAIIYADKRIKEKKNESI